LLPRVDVPCDTTMFHSDSPLAKLTLGFGQVPHGNELEPRWVS
jgi:hypothetical protein